MLESKEHFRGRSQFKDYLKFFLKIAISGLALYWVLHQLNWQEIRQIFRNANFLWLVPSLVLLLISKIVSAYRMDVLLQCIGLPLGKWVNTKLCFIGMYYNLFLPGGIGGDGYKVYLLKKNYTTSLKSLLAATLTDRLGGVVALGVLVCLLTPFSSMIKVNPIFLWVGGGWILIYLLYYVVLKILFPIFLQSFWVINGYSLLVQGVQVVCAITILLSLNVEGFFIDYAILFLLSSLAAMLPFTIGGAGAREATLLFLPHLLKMPVDTTEAVTMSMLFFLITVVSSLPGAFIRLQERQVA